MRDKPRPLRLMLAPVVTAFVLGALLLMLWPGLFAILLAVLMMIQSCAPEQEMAVMPWAGASLFLNPPSPFFEDPFVRAHLWRRE